MRKKHWIAAIGLATAVSAGGLVVTALPAAAETGMSHDCTALPSTMTVHAPQRPVPQPKRAPFSFKSLRST